jgi:hypothetical protein
MHKLSAPAPPASPFSPSPLGVRPV